MKNFTTQHYKDDLLPLLCFFLSVSCLLFQHRPALWTWRAVDSVVFLGKQSLRLFSFPEIAHLGLSAVPGPATGILGTRSRKNMVVPKVVMRLEGMASPCTGRETF